MTKNIETKTSNKLKIYKNKQNKNLVIMICNLLVIDLKPVLFNCVLLPTRGQCQITKSKIECVKNYFWIKFLVYIYMLISRFYDYNI